MEAYLEQHTAGTGAPGPGIRSPIRRELLADALNRHPDYCVFGFVRNPFDRVVSTWKHGLRGTGCCFERLDGATIALVRSLYEEDFATLGHDASRTP